MQKSIVVILIFLFKAGTSQQVPPPDILWGPLFIQVQLSRVLGDNKTFVDATPKYKPEEILKKFAKAGNDTAFNLYQFVIDNFNLPPKIEIQSANRSPDLKDYLEKQWDHLIRKADDLQPFNSLLPLPKPYIVPGGRFREIYYWDSYFTMLGLAASNRYEVIENMLDNFSFLINTYGHIPNGNRNYYLSRSQPPYFALMVDLLQQKKGTVVYKRYLPALQKEYSFWMNGEHTLKIGEEYKRIVSIDGVILNRYWDDENKPRQESYYEDVQTGFADPLTGKMIYRNLRAGAESGWDFSSRWFADTLHLSTIETTDIIPVDLNCLLYYYEQLLSKIYKNIKHHKKAAYYLRKSNTRKNAIIKYCWNDSLNSFFDYDFKQRHTTNKYALSGVMPMLVKIATPKQATAVKSAIEQKFLKPGGVVTTTYNTGQQWDAPNGWAPLQFNVVTALINYGFNALARTIATRWMYLNEKVYYSTGKMMEKYNVENMELESGGGEYPTQDGFGWTNGVYLKFHQMFK